MRDMMMGCLFALEQGSANGRGGSYIGRCGIGV